MSSSSDYFTIFLIHYGGTLDSAIALAYRELAKGNI